MKIQILDETEDDLQEGRNFYERCESGIGDYFIASLAADIDSLRLFAGSHPVAFDFARENYCDMFFRFPKNELGPELATLIASPE